MVTGRKSSDMFFSGLPALTMTLYTDASKLRNFPGIKKHLRVFGQFFINLLDMSAMLFALKEFQSQIQNQLLLLATDNAIVVAYF